MGFSLKNMLQQAVAQINPFDNGQTAHTVAQQHPVITQSQPVNNNRNIVQQAWDQVNPFDNGRTWQQAAPQQQPASVWHMATHNGLTNAGGDVIHSVTNVAGAPVNLLRGMASQYIMHDPTAALKDYNQAQQDAKNNIVTGLGQQLAGTGQALYDVIGKQGAALLTNNQQASDNANAAAVRDFNKTPFGQVFDPLQHKLAEYQVHRDLGNLSQDQQKQAIKQNEASAGLDPNASLGKQALTSGLAGLQLATADKFVNGVPIKEDLAAKAAATKTAVPQIIQAAHDSKVPQIIAQAGNAAKTTAGDIITGKPYRNITDEEMAAASKVRAANQGLGSPMDLTEQDMAHYYSAMKKAGSTSANDIKPLDDAIGARQTYQTRMDYMNSPEVKQGGYAKNPFADPNNTDPLLEKGKQALGNLNKEMATNDKLMAEANGTQDVLPADQATNAAAKITQQDKQTGIVDKQLNQIQKAKKDVINYAANELRQAGQGARDINKEIKQAGGISKSDYEDIPSHLKNQNGLPMDEMAANLGFKSDGELHDAIHNQASAAKPMSKAEALAEAEKQLESGDHPYSADYQQIKDALAKRQDELSLYPKGTRAQVKVTDKPQPMSEQEFASLAKQPEAQVKPAGNKIVEPTAKNEIRNIDAERQAIEDLKAGHGTDTAIENYQKATGVSLQKAVKDINRVAKEAEIHTDLGKNPIEGHVVLPHVDEGDWRQATLNSRFVQSKELELGGKALDSYKGLSAHDQVLLKDIEQGTVRTVAKNAENPGAFTQAAKDIRNYYDHRHAYDKALGIDVGYRTNYLRQLFDRVQENPKVDGEEVVPTGDEQMAGGHGANRAPGYTKERTMDTLGTDVGHALEKDIKGSSFNHAKLAYENGLNEAFPGKIASGERPRSANDGEYEYLQHPFGKDLSAPKDIAHEINSRVWKPNDSKVLDAYDKLNHAFKYIKLSGGLFHAFTESGNFIGQQLASGKLFSDVGATGKMFHVFFSKDAMHHELTRMADEGTLDKAHLAGLTTTPREILADANVSMLDKAKNATNIATKVTGIKAMHDATFQREIPYAKLKIFEQRTQGLDPMKPADLQKMRSQATAINNLFGGINREIQGIKPSTFKWVQRGLLATDFTEGKWHTLYKAATAGGEEGTIARQAVVGKALLFGLLATAGAAAGGDYQGKTGGQIAKDAAGNLLDPSFEMGGYKVGFPKTHISEAVDAVKPTNKNGKAWNASGIQSYLQNRSAALPSEVIQLMSNKNYYGQPLYGTNTKKNGGGKISGGQAASNIAQTVLPIPVGQAATTAAGKQNVAAAVANVIGFKAKPNSDNNVSFQGVQAQLSDKQTAAYTGQLNNTLKSATQQLQSSDSYKNASPNDQAKMMTDLKKNVNSAVQRDFASKNNLGQYDPSFTGKDTKATTKQQDILNGKINPDSYVPNSGNNDSYAVSQFKKSSKQTTTIGDQTYYKTSDGTVKHQATFDYNMGIDTAKVSFAMDRAKATNNYSGWANAAQQQYDLLQKQIDHLNPNSQQADILKLRKQQADLVDTAQKYSSYGGFSKPKSASSRAASGQAAISRTEKNAYTYNAPKSSNDSLRSMLAAARISSPGSGRKFRAKQVVKVA